ncbi:hypothetical protein [Pseudomonas jessenii]|jgi:hypothetical protein|uniref:hypothetical protein n=1 Tax=Pseudomonas jessenii TaxID=77298 RepID=UPI0032E40B53
MSLLLLLVACLLTCLEKPWRGIALPRRHNHQYPDLLVRLNQGVTHENQCIR